MLKPKLRRLLDRLLLIPALVLVIGPVQTAAAAVLGDEYYVSGSGDDLYGDGTEGNPWRTISWAFLQSSGGAPTIHVGAGDYQLAEGGPGTGEAFPIPVDHFDDQGLRLVGPGDGTARILNYTGTEELGKKGGGSSYAGILESNTRINGTVEVSGLRFESVTGGLPLPAEASGGDDSQILVDFEHGVESLTISNNEISGLVPLHLNVAGGGSYLIENNYVTNGGYTGVYMTFDQSSSSSGDPIEASMVMRGNTFLGVDYAFSCYMSIDTSEHLTLDVLVENNTFTSCSSPVYPQFSVEEGATLDYESVVVGNTFDNCEYPYYRYINAEGTVNADVLVGNNQMSLSDSYSHYPGIYFATTVSSSAACDLTMLIEENQISGFSDAIEMNLYITEEGGSCARDVSILNNVITDCWSGIQFSVSMEESSANTLNDHVVIDGNAISGVNNGIAIYQEVSSSASAHFDYEVTRNGISFDDSGGSKLGKGYSSSGFALYLEAYHSSSAVFSGNFELRGNVLSRDLSSGPPIAALGGFSSGLIYVGMYGDPGVSNSITFDAGDALLPGYNTINSQENAGSSSVAFSVNASSSATLNMIGNWWGTTSLLDVESRVYHSVDNPYLSLANLGGLYADELEFEASKSGNKIKLTASEGSGFVAYAGSTLIEVTVDGVVEDDVTVADDYGSLTFPKSGYSGSVTICVTNPGGQAGCTTFTVPSSGGGGCGVIPVNGGTPNAGQFFAQYFLLLLPMLLLLRRRMRGVRPQPVGYAA